MKQHYARTLSILCSIGFALNASAQWQSVGVAGSTYGIVAHNGALFAGSLGGLIHKSTDHGETWTDANTGITETSNWWLASEQGVLFCGTQFGAAFRSTDDGATWENIGLEGGARGFVEHNDTLYACQWYSSGQVDYSTDGGATWQDTQTITGSGAFWPMISVNGDLLVGGQSGGIQRITHSNDTWATSNTGLISTEVYSFARFGDVLFAGTGTGGGSGGGVFRSNDFGATWMSSGLNDEMVYALHSTDTVLFAGTANSGVYMSTDTGATWTAFNDGLTTQQVVRITSDDLYLYAGTLGGGIFRYGVAVGLEELREEPFEVSAYPVPCDGSLTTSIRLAAYTDVTVRLCDAMGRVVAERREERLSAGTHTLFWSTGDLAPGLYSCRVVAGRSHGVAHVVKQ